MKRITTWTSSILVLALVSLLLATPFFFNGPVDYLRSVIEDNSLVSAFAFVSLMFIATVVAPITALPLVPLFSPIFGPFHTTLYVILGWGLGAVVAFLLARYIGRPALSRFVHLQTIKKYEERLPKYITFWGLVFLRMVIPVDVLSYAMGFMSTMRFLPYTLATMIGITPFAFLFSYVGVAYVGARYLTLFALFALAVVTIVGAIIFLRATQNSGNNDADYKE